MAEANYSITLYCETSEDAEKFYNSLRGDILVEDSDEEFTLIDLSYDIDISFYEAGHGVKDASVYFYGFSYDRAIDNENVWNIVQSFREVASGYGVEIVSCVINRRCPDRASFKDYYYPAPVGIAEKLKENLDLSNPDNKEAYEEQINMIWGFGINEDQLDDLMEEESENFMCGEYDTIDEILQNAAKGEFGDMSHYIQITSDGVEDIDINLTYLAD